MIYFSDDAGSDSSADDGLPKHLEVIAAAKVDLFKFLILYEELLFASGSIEKSKKENGSSKNHQRS